MSTPERTPVETVSRPVTDPTTLTTAAVDRGVSSLRELLETRLNGMDKLIKLLQESFLRRDQEVAVEIQHLQKLHEEKFHSISIQFSERDARTEQSSKDSRVAVDAALKAQQDAFSEQNKSSALAIAKSEAAITKQIDQMNITISAMGRAHDDKINDLKTRQDRAEGQGKGVGMLAAILVGSVGLVSSIVAMVISIINRT